MGMKGNRKTRSQEKGPIFIIGSPRSGTTLLRLILDSHPNISCGPETFFLADMKSIVTRHSAVLKGFGFDQDYWNNRIASFFEEFQESYAYKRGRKRWAEKTPVYTLHLEFIDQLFPDAQYIHLIRDAAGVISSHRDRWGYLSGLKAVRRWPRYVRAARKFGQEVGASRWIEIAYENLVADPESEARRVFGFLEEPWDPAVLQFDRADHDFSGSLDSYSSARRSEAGETSLIYTSRAAKAGTDLDPFLKMLSLWSKRQV